MGWRATAYSAGIQQNWPNILKIPKNNMSKIPAGSLADPIASRNRTAMAWLRSALRPGFAAHQPQSATG
jgi:hypothetical protein